MKSTRLLRNESGGAFLIMVIVMAAVMSTIGYFASIQNGVVVGKRADLREQISAMIVLEQLGVMYKQSFDTFQDAKAASAAAPTCPAGTTYFKIVFEIATPVELCVPTATAARCVQDPRTNLATKSGSSDPSLICSYEHPNWPEAQGSNESKKPAVIVKIEALTPSTYAAFRKNVQDPVVPFRRQWAESEGRASAPSFLGPGLILGFYENQARAAPADLPPSSALGGMTNSIAQPDSATFQQKCSGSTGGTDLSCIMITVCMRSACDPGQYFGQIYGFAN